jgi:hypothetical protein
MTSNTTASILDIIKLAEDLAPEAVALIFALAKSLAGKSADEVFVEASNRFAAIHAKARAEQGLPPLP